MEYLSITLATDWFFVQQDWDSDGSKRFIAHRLAVWALMPNGEVVGLLPHRAPAKTGAVSGARLAGPPLVAGEYLHRDQLTPEMRQCG